MLTSIRSPAVASRCTRPTVVTTVRPVRAQRIVTRVTGEEDAMLSKGKKTPLEDQKIGASELAKMGREHPGSERVQEAGTFDRENFGKAGEKLEEGVQNIGDKIKEAGQNIKEGVQDAGDKLQGKQ